MKENTITELMAISGALRDVGREYLANRLESIAHEEREKRNAENFRHARARLKKFAAKKEGE